MEDITNGKLPLFKKIDREVFSRIDKFKTTPGYNNIQDFFNGLEEEQQKVFKGAVILLIFLLPLLLISFLWWQNNNLKSEIDARISLIAKANEVVGLRQGLTNISPRILSENPIDGASMMTSRISNLLSSMGVDISKVQVSNYNGEMLGTSIMRSEADFAFNNFSTDELMNVFTSMIQREKFKIQSVDITRNAESNLLKGQFHAIHFSNAQTNAEED